MSDANDMRQPHGDDRDSDQLSLHSSEESYDEEATDFVAQYNCYACEEKEKGPAPWWRKYWALVRPYYILDHLTWKDSKVIIRSFIQIFVGVVLTTIHPVSTWLGNAPYLLQIFGFFTASGGVSTTGSVYAQLSIFMGLLYSWVFSVITMKIKNRLHGYMTSEQLAELLIREGACEAGPGLRSCIVHEVYTGRFINAKVAAVSALTIIAGKVFFGMCTLRNVFRKPVYISGAISLIIQTCYGVFWPTFTPVTLAMVLLKPIGVSCALGLVVSFTIWPQTASHQYVGAHTGILAALAAENTKHTNFFKSMRPSLPSFQNYKNFKNNVHKIKNKLNPLQLLASILRYEIAYSRFDLGDLARLAYFVRSIATFTAGYDHFYELFHERKEDFCRRASTVSGFSKQTTRSSVSTGHHGQKLFTMVYESYKKVGVYEDKKRAQLLKQRIDSGETYTLEYEHLDVVADLLIQHGSPCLEATHVAFGAITKWLADANAYRVYSLFSRKKHQQAQKANHAAVLAAKEQLLKELERVQDPSNLEELFRTVVARDEAFLFAISQAAIFVYLVRSQCIKVIEMMDFLMEMDERRPDPTIITYFTKRNEASIEHNEGIHEGNNAGQSDDASLTPSDPLYRAPTRTDVFTEYISRRDPDAAAPSRLYQKLGLYLVRIYKVLSHHTLWFFIRSGGLTVLTATPYFVRTTAGWYYRNRCVWVVVMCMMTDTELTGDSVYGFCWKLYATFVGAVIGMVSWYISTGNPYGYAVVSAVVYLFCIYFRHFSVHTTPLPCIMIGISSALVLATSYVDRHGLVSSNIGSGFRVAWMRFVTVIIGLSVGFLGCMFPRPYTSTVVNRKRLSNIITQIGDLHCMVARFANHRMAEPKFHIRLKNDFMLGRFQTTFVSLAKVNALMGTLRNEIPLTGYWPEAQYRKLQSHIYDVASLYFLLCSLVNQVQDPVSWNPIIARRVGWTNSSVQAILFSIVHMSSDALLTKSGLPKVTPSNLSMRHYELLTQQWRRSSLVASGMHESDKEEEREKDTQTDREIDTQTDREIDTQYSAEKDTDPEKRSGDAGDELADGAEKYSRSSLSSSVNSSYSVDPVELTSANFHISKQSSRVHTSILANLDFERVLSHDGQLATTSLLLAHLIYIRLDQIMLVVKSLVGEKYDMDMSLLEDM